jgi:hypothetical protein
LISQEGFNRAELTGEGMERREFKLKGINNPVAAWEMRISATSKIDQ